MTSQRSASPTPIQGGLECRAVLRLVGLECLGERRRVLGELLRSLRDAPQFVDRLITGQGRHRVSFAERLVTHPRSTEP